MVRQGGWVKFLRQTAGWMPESQVQPARVPYLSHLHDQPAGTACFSYFSSCLFASSSLALKYSPLSAPASKSDDRTCAEESQRSNSSCSAFDVTAVLRNAVFQIFFFWCSPNGTLHYQVRIMASSCRYKTKTFQSTNLLLNTSWMRLDI